MKVLRPNFEKRGGLVVVVAQDATTLEVLMVAYVDEAGWLKTLETGLATYYSTSRKESWVKGATSDNMQKVLHMHIDCDGDALVYLVEPLGHRLACHLNSRSCFSRDFNAEPRMVIPDLETADELKFIDVPVHHNFFNS